MLKKKQIIETRPVYEFRPLPDVFKTVWGEVRRYADGKWIPDDGEYDIAFIGREPAPICLHVEHSYQRSIIAGWCTGHWGAFEKAHPRGNAWHYALRDGETEWGGDWGRERNLNYQAGRSGMNKMSSEYGCSNGRHVELNKPDDPHISAGLVRDRETKEIFVFPSQLICMYCEARFEQSTGEPS
jgi:hypothetical protein